MRTECYFCHVKTIRKLIEKFKHKNGTYENFIRSIHDFLGNNWDVSNPNLATDIHRIAKETLKVNDLYESEKINANSILLSNYKYWRRYIDKSINPFHTAVKLAVTGNIIDYGAHSVKTDLIQQINDIVSIPLKVDKTEELLKAIEKADSILYLGDNAGEIFFDKLLIETTEHPNITFVTRGEPVINDITIDDAIQVGMDKICNVITNGNDAPSTLLDKCSEEFIELYNNTDLIISKGQGNFEGLMNENHPNTFFLLIAKCNPMAELLGCSKNDKIVTNLDRIP